jgi:hypothetical protein
MQIADREEVEAVLAFFRKHIDRELDINFSVFDGLIQHYRLLVAEVHSAAASVILVGSPEQHRIELHLQHYSFATVSPDHKKVEIGRLLGGSTTLRLTASEITR